MTTQITVRLPDALVAFVDGQVAAGHAKSRAEAVAHALTREQRRWVALADVEILRADGGQDPLSGLAEYAAAHPPQVDGPAQVDHPVQND